MPEFDMSSKESMIESKNAIREYFINKAKAEAARAWKPPAAPAGGDDAGGDDDE